MQELRPSAPHSNGQQPYTFTNFPHQPSLIPIHESYSNEAISYTKQSKQYTGDLVDLQAQSNAWNKNADLQLQKAQSSPYLLGGAQAYQANSSQGSNYYLPPDYAPTVEHLRGLDISSFKTKQCTRLFPHSHKHCEYYHSYIDKRRELGSYQSERCKYFGTIKCPKGDLCDKSHNKVERLYHPEKYRSKYCNDLRNGKCMYGDYCCFAHSDMELTITKIDGGLLNEWFVLHLFKTVWCPYNHSHNKANCVYAHNWQDFRRRPDLFKYTNKMCPNWDGNKYLRSYEEGCKNMANCNFCHGWKEFQYHPLCYKVNSCSSSYHNSQHCPNYHNEQEKRNPFQNSLVPMFILVKFNPSNVNDQMEYSLKEGRPVNFNYINFDEESEYEAKCHTTVNKVETTPLNKMPVNNEVIQSITSPFLKIKSNDIVSFRMETAVQSLSCKEILFENNIIENILSITGTIISR